ncbi:MAG: cyclic nucleotide-binding domain-containing protein [Mycobacteriales bacterium]
MRPALRVVAQVVSVPALVRVVVAYALFTITEYAVWIGVLVYAYSFGGATAAGLVALAQLAPATVLAPLIATLADRYPPGRTMTASYGIQTVATAAIGVCVLTGAPPLATYAAAVVASTAMTATRPAQAALTPGLTRSVEELAATNVVVGWLESLGIVLAGLVAGLALAADSLTSIFAGSAVMLLSAMALVAPLRVPAAASPATGVAPEAFRQVARGIKEVTGHRQSRLLVGLLGSEYILIGALDVLFVVVAVEVLHRTTAWTGYLNTAFGAGGVLLGSLAALLVGRRLGPVICTCALLTGLALGATLLLPGPVTVVALLAVVGGSRALYDVATRTLLQRAVPADLVARMFGLAEGLSMAGLAVGSLLTPALVAIGGGKLALAGVAAVLPMMVLVRGRVILRLDDDAHVPVVEIALLRSLRIFQGLPATALEGVARSLVRVDVEQGAVVIRQGDLGTHYYAIAAGELDVRQDGIHLRTLGRGEGAGEIALLRGVPRTASVVALTSATLYSLDREAFLAVLSAHTRARSTASAIVGELRAGDLLRSGDPAPG